MKREDLSLRLFLGTNTTSMGNCTLTVDAQLLATLNGDVLTGRLSS